MTAIILIAFLAFTSAPEHKDTPEATGSITEVTGSITEVESLATGEVVELGHGLGTFTVTAYCACPNCCGAYAADRPDGVVYGAIGEPLTPYYSIAVDPNVIALGDTVTINGQEYKAQDTGGGVKGNHIDIYMDDHEAAIEWGVQYLEVYN